MSMNSLLRRSGWIGTISMLGLVAGHAVAQDARGLPGGATSLKESHGDWTVTCAVEAHNEKKTKACALSQTQADSKSRQRVLAIELHPKEAAVEGTLILPFGLALDQGVSLQIDDGAVSPPSRFRTCLLAGCLVTIGFDAKMLAALRKATVLRARGTADGGKEVLFTISLKGFGGALDRAIALAK
jgi:invasion protein IalB